MKHAETTAGPLQWHLPVKGLELVHVFPVWNKHSP